MTRTPSKPPPKGKGAKPFLADDDLQSELDAWDATFDALHGGPEQSGKALPALEWPDESQAAVGDQTALTPVPEGEATTTQDDAALEVLENTARERQQTRERDEDSVSREFRKQQAEEFSVDDEPKTRVRSPQESARLRRPTTPHPVDESDIYTSASRQLIPAPPRADSIDDDTLAPPPVPERRGPAIVRRSMPMPAVRVEEPTPPGGHDLSMLERTRVETVEAMEERVSASHQVVEAPAVDEDDYADIEIDADAGAVAEAAPAIQSEPASLSQPVSRRTAHVLRRELPTRPPPQLRESVEPVIELDIEEEQPIPRKATTEDDFSDVAAAVGAEDDLGLAHTVRPGARGLAGLDDHTAAPQRPESVEGAYDDTDPPARRPLSEALDELGDREPDPGQAATPRERPPSLMDLYPRVKTPTSVPPLGEKAFGGALREALHTERAAPAAALADTAPQTQKPGKSTQERVARLPTPLSVVGTPGEAREPLLDPDTVARAWPEQAAPMPSNELDEACAQALLVYEREVATLDDSATSAALRIEAGRLCERLADLERARAHYDAALLADPRSTPALRGLRRIARASGDLGEATRHLDSEIAVAGALERRPLGHYRVDLLMASGEQDLARVAVGEILDSAPSDIRALLAQLELAFLDGRAEEFGSALEQIAHAVTDNELRAAVQSARGVLAAHHEDMPGAARWFAAAAESDPGALGARLGAVRHAVAQGDGDAAAHALVDVARQIEATDPVTAASAALRALQWGTGELAASAAAIATGAAPTDALVAQAAAESASAGSDAVAAGAAFAHWSTCATVPAERAYAAARAAELDPAHGAELWASVLELDPGGDYAAAQLRTAHVASDATQASIDVDLGVAADAERERARLRAAYGMIALGQLDAAIEVLQQGRAARPASLALAEAYGEALAAAGKWNERAKLFAELAGEPGEQLDREVAQLRSALAWEEAVGAAAVDPGSDQEASQRATAAGLDAWERVLEHDPHAPAAHAASLVLATRLGDRELISEVLARAQAAERSPWAAASLAYRRARLHAAEDPDRAEALLRDVKLLADPRRTVGLVLAAARDKEIAHAATALEERAAQLPETASNEIAGLKLRAAQLALDAGDAQRATRLLHQVEQALPNLGVVPDLLAAARRRSGDRTLLARRSDQPSAPGVSAIDAFARIVRDADLAIAHNDSAGALLLFQRALELRPGDPLATVPLMRLAIELKEAAPITALALARLRAAEDAGDGAAKAMAYELLAHIDAELRGDPESAQIALESAAQSDTTRIDLMHRLERHYAIVDELDKLIQLRRAELELVPPDHARDRGALQLDLAALASRDNRPDAELADLYRAVLETDAKVRLALLHLESIVRGGGASAELARLEENIAAYFEGDARTQAAFWCRAGETLVELGDIDQAVRHFNNAEAALPGHAPALEGWRQAALKGQLWLDAAESATRQAACTTDPEARARLHHFAGVALMDKALVGEQAQGAFRKALEADPTHKDAFLRLRILLEEDADHDELAQLLAQRLDHETESQARSELHRALAELHRNFLSDRDTAKHHYRMILETDPNDLRAHAAIADIAWEQGNWQEAADALMARARLESQPEVLKTLCFRLGLIYADRLVDVPMALKAFQRALTYQPDDENTLIRLADLATQVGEWKLALGACERLVKNEGDADRRVAHLHRVARIFKTGFSDTKRAERALNLALDGAPTNDEALQTLVQFYKEAGDITSVRVHLNRIAGGMRARVAQSPLDGVAYRVIARSMLARASTGVPGSVPVARAAAELADLLGCAGEPELTLLRHQQQPNLSLLAKQEADDVLFPRSVQIELRQIFLLLGDRIAKHVGVDLRPYGATRGDRLRARDNPVAAVAQSVASGFGFGDIDVYVSSRQPWAMVAEPTSPVSLIIGSSIAAAGGDAIRFAAGGALKLAQASLAIPARLALDDLGVLTVALLRLFQPELTAKGIDPDAVASQAQKLKRLIPSGLVTELKPFALAVDALHFSHVQLARDLKIAALRAGLVASGSLLAGLQILAAQSGGELPGFLADPVAQGLVSFALSEDHAAIAR